LIFVGALVLTILPFFVLQCRHLTFAKKVHQSVPPIGSYLPIPFRIFELGRRLLPIAPVDGGNHPFESPEPRQTEVEYQLSQNVPSIFREVLVLAIGKHGSRFRLRGFNVRVEKPFCLIDGQSREFFVFTYLMPVADGPGAGRAEVWLEPQSFMQFYAIPQCHLMTLHIVSPQGWDDS
jgi:hypothetical protein